MKKETMIRKELGIQSINDLREDAIKTLEKLSCGEISIEEAGVTGKLYENIVSTVRLQLDYAKALNQPPEIDFLEEDTLPNGRVIDWNQPKQLEGGKK